MDEKLIIELDNDKIKYAVFKTNEELDYKLLTNKISKNAGIKKCRGCSFGVVRRKYEKPISHRRKRGIKLQNLQNV